MIPEMYLGDGVYASYDGWQIRLRTSREDGDHEIYLDGQTFSALKLFVDNLRKQLTPPI
jgi:hypothetical protein